METKKIQQLITGILAIVLLGVVGAYVYYGMYLAKQSDVAAEVENAGSTPVDNPTSLSSEQKMAILNSLNETNESTTTPSTTLEEREQILNSLTATNDTVSTTPRMSDDQKRKILESLNSNE